MLKELLIRKTVSYFPATEKIFQRLHTLKMHRKYRKYSRGVILLYHRIAHPSGGDSQLLYVTPENFREHLKYLSENFIPTSVSELLSAPRDCRQVAITFDDGYRDNFVNAAPILEEYNFPAEFFIATAGLEQTYEFYWDFLEQIFPLEKDWNVEQPPKTENQKRYLHECMIFHSLDASDREKRLRQLIAETEKTPVLREDKKFLSPKELLCLAEKKGITIGAHTKNHVSLTHLTDKEAWKEITESKQVLEQLLQRKIRAFSYPFGTLSDFSAREENMLKAAGFSYGIANYESPVLKPSRYAIPRILVRNWPLEIFAEKIKAFLP